MRLGICRQCAATLTDRRSHAVYCSTRCRVAAHRDKKAGVAGSRSGVADYKRTADYTLADWRRTWLHQLRQLAERNQVTPTPWSLDRERELRRILGAS